ncbi:flavin-dependent oxidoreductase [Actinoallomurus purpureus]|uniref:flavin-dependent oxidoreductase n=1 Tax=Actinoallomurus purpureus TaxID=478114 RepID=UPI00209298FD|nr:flavin-dependent oxidoreductase [Actinoallomurus purpureus]MCO6009602.1 flavin-dependent oxidoreductase [Actinoallomurus purpureus]
MNVLIVGAGIAGLTTALALDRAGIDACVVEATPELRPLGVGINLQPHAVRELTELGLAEALEATGIPTREMITMDRFGNRIAVHPRGRHAGYAWPQYSIHRGELQMLLVDAVRERQGHDAVRTGLSFEGFAEDSAGVEARLRDRASGEVVTLRADLLVGADGILSAARRLLHPDEGAPLWNGVRMWRGVTEVDRFLTGDTMLVAGAHGLGRMVAYPISKAAAERGRSLVNWVAEVRVSSDPQGREATANWTRAGRLEDVLPYYADWCVDGFDVPGLLSNAESILDYPMVDRDPLPFWGRGRVTLAGDAAHPMYPVGSNGASQAILDARVLARELASSATDPVTGLRAYEEIRLPGANAVAMACRDMPLDRVLDLIAERAPGGFGRIEDILDAEELAGVRAIWQQTTDMDAEALNTRESWDPIGSLRA